ncbi:MAG: carbohydrate ABC transporter permease [Alphaproteobacteria bacterium]|nr:MAG: carbohydrate ABC transporter permease [Alphaproteobacteria bacterium]
MGIIRNGAKYGLIIIVVTLFAFPIYWMLMTSVKPADLVMMYPPVFWPPEATFKPYLDSLIQFNSARIIVNSLIISGSATLISLILGAAAGYGFARYRIGGFHLPFWILSTRMMPAVAAIIPMFLLMKNLRLIDTHVAVIAMHLIVTLPFAVWMMRGFFIEVPKELEEAAEIDGCSKWQAFIRIALPLTAPGLAVTALFCFIFSWNEFLFAFILTRRAATTLPVLVSGLYSQHGIMWDVMSATAAMSLLPVVVLALIAQKYLVHGMTMGAIR